MRVRLFQALAVPFALAYGLMALSGDTALAHPGGLDAKGCHNNRKTGDYHCHRGAAQPAQRQQREPDRLMANTGRAYANCTEARTAGAAPVYRGQPGYGPHLDRDGDGIGCEPYRGR